MIALLLTRFAEGKNEIKKYLQENAIQVMTIEPDAVSYLNWEEIGNALENSTIVMLGEQDHGAVPIFLVKARAINIYMKRMVLMYWLLKATFSD
jgi:hypothetical protein